MVMARLFAEFFRLGGVVVATSNRPPDQLYERGLQRSMFLPFIATLKKRCIVHDMESTTDYRCAYCDCFRSLLVMCITSHVSR
jgi:protein AFG1